MEKQAIEREKNNKRNREWNKNNPGKLHARWRRYYTNHQEVCKERSRKQKRANRADAFTHYGNFCACCGEHIDEFLTIDHIIPPKQKSGRERKDLYGWLKKHNYPEGFQTLCWNCNMAKNIYGVCPHEIE